MRRMARERRIIGGRYELSRVAGSGGAGRVYQAVDLRTGGVVALKLLLDHYGSDVARFTREATVLERLRHEGIVRYLDHGEAEDGRPYLVMEWLEGVPLSEELAGDFGLARSVTLMKRLGAALAYAHRQGVVHRDIKPSNVILVGGRAELAKLVDFGLALEPGQSERVTGTGVPVGTPAYMAPETIQGQRGATPASDVFSLGALFYRCVAGQSAFAGPNVMAVLAKVVVAQPAPLRDVRPFIPASIERLVARMLQKEPADRFRDAGEFLAALLRSEATHREREPISSSSSSLGVEERRLISVLMADAGASSGADPARLERVAERYMAESRTLPTGQLVFVFGGGGEASDLVHRAARCALELRAALEGAAFAVITGPGDPRRRQPGGDVIDAAVAALQASAGAGTVVLDATTKNLLGARFTTRAEGSSVVLESFADHGDPGRLLLGRATPFVGRKRELEMALSCFEGVVEERASAALFITGQAGIGKSRLREEIVERLRASPSAPQILLGRPDAHYGGAYDLARRLLCAAADIRPEFPAVAVQALLRARVERVVPASLVPAYTALLAEIAGAPFEGDAGVDVAVLRGDAPLLGARLTEAFGQWLAAEASAHPTVLIVEDLQFADEASLALVGDALRRAEAAPLLVIGLSRPCADERIPASLRERRRVELGLGPLPEPAIRELVDAVVADIEGIDSDSLAARSGGNPLFVEELIRAAAAGRPGAAPQSVIAMLHARFEALPSLERRVARLASIYGESFSKEAIAALSGESATAGWIDDALAALVESEIVERVEAGVSLPPAFRFRSDFWREAAYSTFVDADRVSAHRAAGERLAARGGASPLELAHHFEQGRDPRACDAYADAAALALTAGDAKSALALVDRGVSVAHGGEAFGRLRRIEAEAHKWAGSNDLAIDAAREAVSMLPWGSGDWLVVVGELAAAEGKIGNPASVYSLRDALVSTTSAAGLEGLRAVAAARIAMQLALSGDPDAAGALLETEASGVSALDDVARGYVLEARSVIAGVRGDRGHRVRLAERAAAAFESGGDHRNAALLGGSVGFALIELGAFERAQGVLSRTIELADSVGAKNAATVARNQLARALLRVGSREAGQNLLREAIRELIEQRNGRLEGVARAYLAESLLEAGELDEAERQVARAVSLLEAAPPLLAPALAVAARLRERRGDLDEAVRTIERAADIARSMAIPSGEGMVRLARIEILRAAGEHDESRASLERGRAWLAARADELDDPAFARSFLAIEEHRAIAEGAGSGDT